MLQSSFFLLPNAKRQSRFLLFGNNSLPLCLTSIAFEDFPIIEARKMMYIVRSSSLDSFRVLPNFGTAHNILRILLWCSVKPLLLRILDHAPALCMIRVSSDERFRSSL